MSAAIVVISHDSFGRVETVRKLTHSKRSCDCCGDRRAKFVYGSRRDDSLSGSVAWDKNQFCGIGCRNSFHS